MLSLFRLHVVVEYVEDYLAEQDKKKKPIHDVIGRAGP